MPVWRYRCPEGHERTVQVPLGERRNVECAEPRIGAPLERSFCRHSMRRGALVRDAPCDGWLIVGGSPGSPSVVRRRGVALCGRCITCRMRME